MIRIYYSGAVAFLAVQQEIDKSIGGNMSSSPVPNDFLNNLFSSVSETARKDEYAEVKGLFLKNETGGAITDLKLYVDYPENKVAKFEFAAVTVPNGESIEKLPNYRSVPFGVSQFYEADGVANEITLIASMAVNSIIGLWVKRTALVKPIVEDVNLEAHLASLAKTETVDIVMNWT